jgi:hypothetical protein
MDTFLHLAFGTVAMPLFQGFFTVPLWQTFIYLACGWALATDRHTLTTYLWHTGAIMVKTFPISTSCSIVSSTTDASNCGAPLSAWQLSCDRAFSNPCSALRAAAHVAPKAPRCPTQNGRPD